MVYAHGFSFQHVSAVSGCCAGLESFRTLDGFASLRQLLPVYAGCCGVVEALVRFLQLDASTSNSKPDSKTDSDSSDEASLLLLDAPLHLQVRFVYNSTIC